MKSKKPAPKTLLSLIVERLHETGNPLLRLCEIDAYPREAKLQISVKRSLVEAPRADEVPHPHRPGSWVAVQETAKGYYGVAPGHDDFIEPVALSERDVRQFYVDVPNFVECIRSENSIQSDGLVADGNLFAVGQKDLDGFGVVDVYLSLVNDIPHEFAARCRGIRLARGVKAAVVLIPRPVALTNTHRQVLDTQGIILVPLLSAAEHNSLAVDWQREVVAASTAAIADGFHAPDTVVWKGNEHKCRLARREQNFVTMAIGKTFIEVSLVMHLGENALWKQRFHNDKSHRDTVSQFLSRLNRKLAGAKPVVPLEFSLKRGSTYIQRRILKISTAIAR
jgi:hypothetical protein